MKLIANGNKDYFDYLIHQYGEDPLVVLDRRRIGEFDRDYYRSVKVEDPKLNSHIIVKDYEDFTYWRGRYVTNFLVLNGKSYPLVKVKGEYVSLTPKFELATTDNSYIEASRFFVTKAGKPVSSEYGQYSEKLVEISKQLKRHCFTIDSNSYVDGLVPNLGKIGIASIISAQDMYLETIDFISKHFAKEMEVSIPQTNNEKIVGHGFDLKTSFRGKK